MYADNVITTLASAHTAGSGSFVMETGYGATLTAKLAAVGYPPIGTSSPFRFTVLPFGSQGVITPTTTMAIYTATGLTGDTLTGCTAVEGTTDVNWAAGDVVVGLWTAGAVKEIQDAVSLGGGAVHSVNGETGDVVLDTVPVSDTDPIDGQSLVYDSGASEYVPTDTIPFDTSNPSDGNVVTWDAGAGKATWAAPAGGSPALVTLADASTIEMDCTTDTVFTLTLTASGHTLHITGMTAGKVVRLRVVAGSFTLLAYTGTMINWAGESPPTYTTGGAADWVELIGTGTDVCEAGRILTGCVTTFSPSDISGMRWYEAAGSAFLDTGATSPCTDMTLIAALVGKNGSTPTATQATSGQRLLYVASGLNGLPTIRNADGMVRSLTLASTISLDNGWAIYVVGRRAANQIYQILGRPTSDGVAEVFNDNVFYWQAENGEVVTHAYTGATGDVAMCIRMDSSGDITLTATGMATVTVGNLFTFGLFRGLTVQSLMTGNYGTGTTGDISVWAIKPSVISGPDHTAMCAWILSRYGVAIP